MNPVILIFVVMAVFGHKVMGGEDPREEALCNATSNFGWWLHQKVALDKQNAIFSPISIHTVLTMSYLGAGSETAREMSDVLELSELPGPSVHEAYHDLILELKSLKDVRLDTFNALYVKPNKSIEQEYKNEVYSKYFADIDNFNLTNPEVEINDLVYEETDGAIKDFLPRGSINEDTSIILVNSIVFNGTWQDQFNKRNTQKQDFFKLDGTKSQVDMMNDTRTILLKRDNSSSVDVVLLPLKSGRFSLCIALPQRRDGITSLEVLLADPEEAEKLCKHLSPSLVEVVIPKFRIENTLPLKPGLQELGMIKAFTPNVADFSGISKDGGIYISELFHKAAIEIDESGVSSAAATSSMAKDESGVSSAAATSSMAKDESGVSSAAATSTKAKDESGVSSAAATSSEAKEWASKADVAVQKFVANYPYLFFLLDEKTKLTLLHGKFSG